MYISGVHLGDHKKPTLNLKTTNPKPIMIVLLEVNFKVVPK